MELFTYCLLMCLIYILYVISIYIHHIYKLYTCHVVDLLTSFYCFLRKADGIHLDERRIFPLAHSARAVRAQVRLRFVARGLEVAGKLTFIILYIGYTWLYIGYAGHIYSYSLYMVQPCNPTPGWSWLQRFHDPSVCFLQGCG